MNPDDYAILIGISLYPELGDGGTRVDLRGPLNDVDAVRKWLVDPLGGGLPDDPDHIHVIKSTAAEAAQDARPTGEQLEAVLAKIDGIAQQNKAARKGTQVGRRIYLYMSGHGFSPARQRGCLYTANATFRQGFNIHATGWLNWLQDSGYFREFVLWMDCCMNRMNYMAPREPQLALVNAPQPPRANFIAFAAQRPLKAVEVEVPEDDGRVHGLFTWTLLEGVRGAAADSNGHVTGRSLADWIRNGQMARMLAADLEDPEVSKEPEVMQEDAALIFARGVAKPSYEVKVSFPPAAQGAIARLWSGVPPRTDNSFEVTLASETLTLEPGLYLIDVPGRDLRHGFEVVKPTEVQIAETGPEVNSPRDGAIFQLTVDPQDPTAEIFVIDHRFALSDSGAGRLVSPLPFRLFKIKTRVGRSIRERVILLDSDLAVSPQAIVQAVSAVAPIQDTATSHEYHLAAASRARKQFSGLQQAGHEAAIMLMARAFTGPQISVPGLCPWMGVSLVDAKGKIVIDLENDGARDNNEDAFAVCVKPVKRGSYYLRQRLDDGSTIEQSVIACSGWAHEVHILRRVDPVQRVMHPRPRVSFMMRRLQDGQAWHFEDRVFEAARLALADERHIMNDQLEALLLDKFENPIAGLIGGHLLLIDVARDPGRDLTVLNTVVTNLQALLGAEHPDVAALALHCTDKELRDRAKKLMEPPMFQRSWKLLVQAAQERPALIPKPMWERVLALSTLPPFLVWAIDEPLKAAARAHLVEEVAGRPVAIPEALAIEANEQAAFAEFIPDAVPVHSLAAAPGTADMVAPSPDVPAPRSRAEARARQVALKTRAQRIGVPPSALKALLVEPPK